MTIDRWYATLTTLISIYFQMLWIKFDLTYSNITKPKKQVEIIYLLCRQTLSIAQYEGDM